MNSYLVPINYDLVSTVYSPAILQLIYDLNINSIFDSIAFKRDKVYDPITASIWHNNVPGTCDNLYSPSGVKFSVINGTVSHPDLPSGNSYLQRLHNL